MVHSLRPWVRRFFKHYYGNLILIRNHVSWQGCMTVGVLKKYCGDKAEVIPNFKFKIMNIVCVVIAIINESKGDDIAVLKTQTLGIYSASLQIYWKYGKGGREEKSSANSFNEVLERPQYFKEGGRAPMFEFLLQWNLAYPTPTYPTARIIQTPISKFFAAHYRVVSIKNIATVSHYFQTGGSPIEFGKVRFNCITIID